MDYKPGNNHIILVKANNREHIKALCNLHLKLLPESLLSELGYLFLSRFYYSKLIENKNIDAYLYVLNNEYVGFVSLTNSPFTFMAEGRKKNFILIGILLFLSVMFKPSRIKSLFRIKQEFAKYAPWMEDMKLKYGNQIGQFLSFGVDTTNAVLEYYRNNAEKLEELNIPDKLMDLVKDYFKTSHKRCFFLMALKTNNKALKLYRKHKGITAYSGEDKESVVITMEV